VNPEERELHGGCASDPSGRPALELADPEPRPGRARRVVEALLGRLSGSAAAQGAVAFLVATTAVNLSNFVFHVVVSRLLGPSNYGELGALLNVLTLLSVPLGAVQAAVTYAEASGAGRGSGAQGGVGVRAATLRATAAGLALVAVLIAASPLVDGFLHVRSPLPVILLAVAVAPSVVGAVLQGVLMGRLRFGPVATSLVLGTILGRLAVGVVLVGVGLGVDGAIAATVLGQLLGLAVLGLALRRELFVSGPGAHHGVDLSHGLLSTGALAGYWVLASLDTILARHFLAPREAGYYAAAATAGRIALFLPGAFVSIAYPRFSADGGRGEVSRRTLRASLVGIGGIGLAAAGVLALFAPLVVEILFGGRFGPAAGAIRLLGVEAAGLGLVSLLVYFHLARASRLSLVCWGSAAVAVGGIWLFHASPIEVALVMLVVVAATFVFSFATAAHGLLAEPAWPAPLPPPSAGPGGEGELDLTVVLPYYNPGPALRRHVEEVAAVLEAEGVSYELVAVSDGSTDDSPASLAGLLPGRLRSVELPANYGKGQALRTGLAAGRGRYLGFIDADGDIPAGELARFVDLVRRERPDIATGSKRHPASEVVYPPARRAYSVGYQGLLWVLFRLKVRDTQTGLKLIRREVLAAALPRMVEKRFAFDLELFVVARRLGYTRVAELPVRIRERFSSTISPKAVWGMLLDTLGIFYRLRVLHYYDRPSPLPREDSSASGPYAQRPAPPLPSARPADAAPHSSPALPITFPGSRPHGPTRGLSIGILIDRSAPTHTGGYERRAWELARRLAPRHEITLLTACPAERVVDGVRFLPLAANADSFNRHGHRSVGSTLRLLLASVAVSLPFPLDILDCNATPFIHVPAVRFRLRQVDTAFVVTAHEPLQSQLTTYVKDRNFPAGRLAAKALAVAYRSAHSSCDALIAASERTFYGLRHEGYSPIGFTRGGVGTLGAPRDTYDGNLVTLSRLVATKRVSEVLRASAILIERGQADSLTVIGDGPQRADLETLAADLGILRLVRFAGEVTESEKYDLLASCSIYLSASLREGLSISTLEALSQGLIAVISSAPGIPHGALDYLAEGINGAVADTTAASLAAAVETIVLDNASFAAMSRSAITTASLYTWDRAATELETLYYRAMERESAVRPSPVGSQPLDTADRAAQGLSW
jgi:O-antigen/teichoic acid export membrane protein/glycosyltransferase involved in cell wall biosynthesis